MAEIGPARRRERVAPSSRDSRTYAASRSDPDLVAIEPLRTTRVEALTDGIFAIAMTLLVFEIPVPGATVAGEPDLLSMLVALWPHFLGYLVTFLVLGGYWMGQHAQFHLIRRVDHVFLWETLLFLMLIAALPFTAGVLGRHLDDRDAVVACVVYCAHLVAIGLAHYVTWHHATRKRELVDRLMTRSLVLRHAALALATPVAYALAIPLALVSGPAALALCALVPITYVLLPHALALRAQRAARRAEIAAHPREP
jgi:uncharacterized membrane protein